MNHDNLDMPLFAKTKDFLDWLVPLTNHFPRIHRYTITKRLIDAALDFLENSLEANSGRGQQRMAKLVAADAQLNKVRNYLRLVHVWKWITPGQYEHGSRLIAELGRLLGGWQKRTV